MKKRIGRRLVSLLLTVVTVLTMLPAMTLPALAANGPVIGLTDETIGLSVEGDAKNTSWSASGMIISGSANGTGLLFQDSWKSTLTITNNKDTTATLSFDFTIDKNDDGTIQVGGEDYTKVNNPFSKELKKGESIKVYIESGFGSDQYAEIKMTNVKLVAHVSATVTFQPAENGSYKVDEKPITDTYTNKQIATKAYQVAADPAPGYQFRDWYNVTTGKTISKEKSCALNVEKDCTITARFFPKDSALFEVGTESFFDLGEAVDYATQNKKDQITLTKDGPLLEGDYTIPSGVTLLIPFNEEGTVYRKKPTATRETPEAKPFRTLTMKAGSSITLASGAAISVGGQYFAAQGGTEGKMVGPYGHIKMESGSTITVQSGGALYAWGFISGSGSVTVQPGGSVYEWYQILDFRGGNASKDMEYNVFPFNQYAVQNIEVPLTVYAGASETVYTSLYALWTTHPTSISFIGDKGLFKLASGSLTKAYDGSTDRMIYTINGVAELNTLSLKLAGMNVNSSSYVLPLTNNMTVDLNSGSKLTVNQTVALLPGVEVSIAKNAELTVASGKSMYIYDVDEWGGYCGTKNKAFIPVVNAPGRTGKRASLEDVKMDVNGKLTAIGSIYTTTNGANICSSEGTGKYLQQGAPGTETKTYQYDGSTKSHEITITPAKLKNACVDKPYTETNTAKAGETFTYCTCPRCDGKWDKILIFAAICDSTGKQTGTYPTLQKAVDAYRPNSSTAPTNYIQLLHNTAENINANSKLYLDLNGCTVTGNFNMNGNTLYGMDSTTDNYDGTTPGKLDGTVTGNVALVHETSAKTVDGYDSLRYVAIKNEDGTEYTFHRFNISVTGYRFELATGDTPQCALFFIGKFQGDKAAKDYLKSLGFTLTDIDDKTTNPRYEIPAGTKIPPESEPGDSPVVLSGDAYLFEAYLMHDIDKKNADTYTKKFSAIAQATFQNDETQNSETKKWSFQEAWQNALTDSDMDISPAEKEILEKFLKDLNIPIPNPKTE